MLQFFFGIGGLSTCGGSFFGNWKKDQLEIGLMKLGLCVVSLVVEHNFLFLCPNVG
jgi:hypothetical protein